MVGSIRWFNGSQAIEAELLNAVQGWSVADGPCLAPRRVIVPSRSLRLHLLRRLARAKGALLGVQVQTHFEIVRQVLDSRGDDWASGGLWSQELSRVEADREPTLRDALGSLDDGYAAVARSVDELLDAGFEASHGDGLVESLRSWTDAGGGRVRVERAIGVVRVAERVAKALDQAKAFHRADMMRHAAACLSERGQSALPSQAIWIVGFSDATGAVTELLRSMVRHLDAEIWIEDPPDPVDASRPDPGRRFAQPFQEGIESLGLGVHQWEPPESQSEVRGMEARDGAHETRLVADRVRSLLDDGASPEDIAVVARSLEGRGAHLRRAFEQCAVPFSGVGGTVAGGGADRRCRAFGDLLQLGSEVELSRWSDVWSGGRDPARTLRTGLAGLGVRRLRDVANFDVDRLVGEEGGLKLDVRQGLETREDKVVAPRFRVARDRLLNCVASATATVDYLQSWPDSGSVQMHLGRARHLVVEVLGWRWNDPWIAGIREATELVAEGVPADAVLLRVGFIRLLKNALGTVRLESIGGGGGGVALLDATEARGRTFEHIFVLGLNRNSFPRVVREDPLLPDDVRRVLSSVLPDLREKRRGMDEERHLFAQLLASSPHVNLSWCRLDGEGKVVGPSSLVVGAQIGGRFESVEADPQPRYADGIEGAISHALSGEKKSDSLQAIVGARDAAVLGRVLDEQQRHSAYCKEGEIPGPYMGFVGPVMLPADVRNKPLYITTAESLARCPWRTALEKSLYIQPAPDPGGDLPMISRMHIGQVVHAAVEALCMDALGGTGNLDGTPAEMVSIAWPEEEVLEKQVREIAIQCLRDDGIVWDGLVFPLVRQAMAALDVLKDVDQEVDGIGASEVTGTWITPRGTPVHYRADRVEWIDGIQTITDLKLAKPVSDKKKPETRYKDLREAVRKGLHLQAAVYSQRGGTGRYLYLNADLEHRSFPIAFDDEELGQDLKDAMREILDARDSGAWFPRVSIPSRDQIPDTCDYCNVREACPVGDSGQRMRIMALAKAGAIADVEGVDAVNAMQALWRGGTEDT